MVNSSYRQDEKGLGEGEVRERFSYHARYFCE
jgi:hypothetical protein